MSQKVPVMLFLLPTHDLVGVGTKISRLLCMVPELWPGQIGQFRAVSMVTALFPHPVKPEPYMLATQFWYLPSLNHVWGARITSLEVSVTFWLARIAN